MNAKHFVLLQEDGVLLRFENPLSEEHFNILTGLFDETSVYSLIDNKTHVALMTVNYEVQSGILAAMREWFHTLPVIQDSDGFEYCQQELSNIG